MTMAKRAGSRGLRLALAAVLGTALWPGICTAQSAPSTPQAPKLSAAVPEDPGALQAGGGAGIPGGLPGSLPAGPALGGFGEGGSSTGEGPVTKLPLPRYVSLRSDEINVRRGPGLDYRTDWVFRRAGMPVKIINEFGDWRQVLDSDKATGWIYHALLTGRRTVLITDRLVDLHAGPEADESVRARAEQGVVADLRRCERDWCEIAAGDHVGWVPKTVIWGVDPGEIYPR